MLRERLVLIIIALTLVSLVFSDSKQILGLRSFLVGDAPSLGNESANPALENIALKAELARLGAFRDEAAFAPAGALIAGVSSRYPFNLKSELLIARGLEHGVSAGDAVFVQGMLIGKIEKVFQSSAIVQTVFDSRWKSAVRVGKNGADALLVGGAVPQLTLIVKDAEIHKGSAVLNAAPDLPHDFPLGQAGQIVLSSDNLFKEAPLVLGYDLGAVRAVSIIKTSNDR